MAYGTGSAKADLHPGDMHYEQWEWMERRVKGVHCYGALTARVGRTFFSSRRQRTYALLPDVDCGLSCMRRLAHRRVRARKKERKMPTAGLVGEHVQLQLQGKGSEAGWEFGTWHAMHAMHHGVSQRHRREAGWREKCHGTGTA